MLPLLLDVLALAFYGLLCFLGYLIRFIAICLWQAVLAACRGVWFGFHKMGKGLLLILSFATLLVDEWRRGAPQEEQVQEEPSPQQKRDDEFFRQFNLNDPPPEEPAHEEEPPPQEEKPLPPPDPYLEALNIFGLPETFTQAALSRAYKGAIRKAHPDTGGSKEQAQAVNTARDLLARRRGWR